MQPCVVTFGEIMMRLSPPGFLRFGQATTLEMSFGGAEANVAVNLAQWGVPARVLTRLPDNPLGRACRDRLRQFGVDTGHLALGGTRLGVYYAEIGAAQRGSLVVYDRADSAFATMRLDELDLPAAFAGATHFHFTGIAPAVSEHAAEVTAGAVAAAKRAGLSISCDLNYRAKLWSRERAGAVMGPLMEHVDLLIANEADAEDVFGIHAEGSDVTGGKLSLAGYEQVARKLRERFGLERVAITLRESLSASHNRWSGVLLDGEQFLHSTTYDIEPIIDRVGGGDSFGAGLLFGLMTGRTPQQALEFAAAASCLKHSILGDWALVTREEVERLVGGDRSGRVKR